MDQVPQYSAASSPQPSKVMPMIVGILIGIILGAGGYWWYQQMQPKTTSITTTSTTTTPATTTSTSPSSATTTSTSVTTTDATADWKTYTNSTYGYTFKYDNDLETSSSSTDANVGVKGKDIDHWVYNISVVKNAQNKTVQQLANDAMTYLLKVKSDAIGTQAPTTDATVTDVSVGGVAAKQVSVKNFGDYGNTQVVLVSGGNAMTISGETGTTANATDLATFLSTFSISK